MGLNADNVFAVVVLVRWNYLNGDYVEAELVFTADDMANGMLRLGPAIHSG